MKKRTIYACLLSFLILFLCTAPSLASSINKVYGLLMYRYSEAARTAAAGVSGSDLNLEFDDVEETIYKLGYARGYDEARASSVQSATSKASSSASSILNSNSSSSTSSSIMVWIPTNGGKKYHDTSTCSNMKNPKKVTLSEAKRLGFDSCGRCHPPE